MRAGSALERLLCKLEERPGIALIEDRQHCSYAELVRRVTDWRECLRAQGIESQHVVALQSDYHIASIALLLALWANGNVVALLPVGDVDVVVRLRDAQADYLFTFDAVGEWAVVPVANGMDTPRHPLLQRLSEKSLPGFIIFSSGTTGTPKAILHDVNAFLGFFARANKPLRTIAFLLFDHIAGLDTLLYTLCSGGTLVIPRQRSPHAIFQLIEQSAVQVLPTSPSFLNLLFLSQDYRNFDVSSLEIVTFGSEPMSDSGLDRVQKMFPAARIVQKYGGSEFGSPRSKSRDGKSLWLKIDNDDFQVKVIDDILWVKTPATMLGYLNCPQAPLSDGYYCTGDRVERDGDWLRILGRDSEMINVGGEKVFPAEVEGVILEFPGIEQVLVYGEHNAMLGNAVCAKLKLSEPADSKSLKKQLRHFCLEKLARYKVPVKFDIVDHALTNERFKRSRA